MKKYSRRLVAICLAVMLILSMSVVASAASRLITRNGTTYMLYLNKLWRSDVVIPLYETESVEHFSGNVTPLQYTGEYELEYHMDCDPIPSWYYTDIEEMMIEDGLFYSAGSGGGHYIKDMWFYVEPDQPSGTYWLSARVHCYRAEWGLSEDLTLTSSYGAARAAEEGGTFYHVPIKGSGLGEWTLELHIP